MFERLQGLARLVVPPGLRYRISRRREVMGLLADRSTRPCFTVASNTDNGAIRVNLKGREPQGIIAPHDMDGYCAQLSEQLLDLRDAETGEPAVREVICFAQRYPGKEVAHSAPDLLVVWNRDTPLRAVTSPATGRVARRLCDVRTGDHSTNTLFIAAGPGITPGALEAGYRVESIAPTLAARFGVEMPGAERASLPLQAAG
jgi:predicted AlkP superfamily phosphohydrolase/phosphomutase